MTLTVLHGDCLDVLPTLDADSVHAVVTDPPYHLTSPQRTSNMENKTWVAPNALQYKRLTAGFMGKSWDGGDVAFRPDTWRAVLRVMKPGAYLVAFASTRGYHRMVCAIEDAGFTIHPMLGWIFGSGFPKATNASKAIDRHFGAVREVIGASARHNSYRSGSGDTVGYQIGVPDITAPATPEAAQWDGWAYGLQSLKPALEPICLAQKPPERGGMVRNILTHGTGALHIDATRVATDESTARVQGKDIRGGNYGGGGLDKRSGIITGGTAGRWPANVLHSGDAEVEAAFAAFGDAPGQQRSSSDAERSRLNCYGAVSDTGKSYAPRGDTGSAARFFARCPFSPDELRIHYSSKADSDDRADSKHPTVKPVSLLRWLVRLITPPNGVVLDPFAGSGTTGEAAMLEGVNALLIEQSAEHVADIRHRIGRWSGADLPLYAQAAD